MVVVRPRDRSHLALFETFVDEYFRSSYFRTAPNVPDKWREQTPKDIMYVQGKDVFVHENWFNDFQRYGKNPEATFEFDVEEDEKPGW